MNDVVTIILAVVGSLGAVTVQSIITRPKTMAEGRQADAAGEVSQSAEARQWVNEFRQEAVAAREAASAAEVRAQSAEDHADECERRCDETDAKFLKLATYTRSLQVWANGDQALPAPPVPAALVPPLDPSP